MLELIIFGGFLGLNMIVSMARESSADFFRSWGCGDAGLFSNFAKDNQQRHIES